MARLDEEIAARAKRSRAAPAAESATSSWDRVYAVVRQIPRGKVATYGQIAQLAGMPRHARQVGYALHTLKLQADVPWQRVVNARGEVSRRTVSENHLLQRWLLEDEGVRFDLAGKIDLRRFGWRKER